MVSHSPKKHDVRQTHNLSDALPIIAKMEEEKDKRRTHKSPFTYRNFYDIIFDLMYMAKVTDGKITRARASTLAGLNYQQTINYISELLIPQGLVDVDAKTGSISVTQKGIYFLEHHDKTRVMLGMKPYEERKIDESPWLDNNLDKIRREISSKSS